MIWENGIKTCIISYKKQITSPNSMQDTGSLGLVHWHDPEGWYAEGGGRGVQDGMVTLSILMQSLKASWRISVIPSANSTVLRFEQFLKA